MSDQRYIDLINDLRILPAETEWVEFKRNNTDPEVIGKRISALSNGARLLDKPKAYFVYGIADEIKNGIREVTGTKFKGANERVKGQPLPFWLANALDPSPHLEFIEIKHPEGRVVLIEIPAASGTTTKFKGDAYIRLGEATPRLSDYPETEKKLWRNLQAYSWETATAMPYVTAKAVIELIDCDKLCELLGVPKQKSSAGILQLMKQNALVEPDVGGRWNILNICACLFARYLPAFPSLERKKVRLIHYQDRSRVRALKEYSIDSGYAIAFETIISTIMNITTHEDIGALRLQHAMYPIYSVRELVANALIHQDMTETRTTPMIEVFSDRIEITNPGDPLVETNRFIDSPPVSRNERIASLMRRMDMCEERGSGIDRVIEAVEDAKLPAPDFIAEHGVTRAILLGPRDFGSMTKQERVRACFQHTALLHQLGKRATNASLRARFGVDASQSAQISRVFADCKNAKLIKLADPEAPKSGYIPYFAG